MQYVVIFVYLYKNLQEFNKDLKNKPFRDLKTFLKLTLGPCNNLNPVLCIKVGSDFAIL